MFYRLGSFEFFEESFDANNRYISDGRMDWSLENFSRNGSRLGSLNDFFLDSKMAYFRAVIHIY